MSSFTAQLTVGKPAFEFREPISGSVTWQGSRPPKTAKIRLAWRTEGKGDRDSELADQVAFERPQSNDERTFTFVAPIFPSSFSGRLISLVWSLELMLNGKCAAVTDITISPRSGEITLERPEWITLDPPSKLNVWFIRQ